MQHRNGRYPSRSGGGPAAGAALTAAGTPAPDVRVSLPDSGDSMAATAATDPDGRYSFENVLAGDYTVIAAGYPPAAGKLHVMPGHKQQHDIQLSQPEA